MKQYNTHLTPKSANKKVGPIPVSTTTADTCPATCPFNNANEGGCYAEAGPLKLHWMKVTRGERGTNFSEFLEQIPVSGEMTNFEDVNKLISKLLNRKEIVDNVREIKTKD